MILIVKKIKGKLKQIFAPVFNMHKHKAEQYYFKQYINIIYDFLKPNSKILDIGCQYGRFTIPLVNKGHTLVCTDINEKYFSYIKKQLNPSTNTSFIKEIIDETILNQTHKEYDAILCLELLYNLNNPEKYVSNLSKLLKKEGLLITSHRSIGYYGYRFLKEKNYQGFNDIQQNKHISYNALPHNELIKLYENNGFKVLKTHGIGIFSGFYTDAFAGIANPQKLNENELNNLSLLENDESLNKMFINNARYILVIAQKID